MSIEYWPIVLYGVRCDNLKVKKEYCDEEDIGQNDVWDFLCSFRDLFDSFGLVFYHSGAGEKYTLEYLLSMSGMTQIYMNIKQKQMLIKLY